LPGTSQKHDTAARHCQLPRISEKGTRNVAVGGSAGVGKKLGFGQERQIDNEEDIEEAATKSEMTTGR